MRSCCAHRSSPCGAIAGALAGLVSPAMAAQDPRSTSCRPRVVRDLHYGDVLFYFYQDEDFEAITRLNAYEHWGRCRITTRNRSCCSAACICRSACTTRPASASRRC